MFIAMGNNILVYDLEKRRVTEEPDKHSGLLKVEDNIGESVHIHYRNIRLDLSISDFDKLSRELEKNDLEVE